MLAEPLLNKTCLLIIDTKFYSFEKHVKEALIKLGYDVTVADHEYPNNTYGKILGKLQLPIIFSSTYKYITENFLDNRSYDIALIIKGRGMSPKLIERIKQSAKEVIGYNYDSFKYNPSPLNWYKYTDSYYTFDYRDGDNYKIPVVELFSSLPGDEKPKKNSYEISALCRNHSYRLKYLHKVLSILKPNTYFIYIFEQNIFSFLVNFIKNPILYLKYWKFIHFKPLKYDYYNDIIRSSEATIDYAHHNQTGITIRCYESINMQTKIISNNIYIKRSKYFNETNALIYNITDSEAEFVNNYKALKNAAFNARSRDISDFIKDLVVK
jgi:hypothetical protein